MKYCIGEWKGKPIYVREPWFTLVPLLTLIGIGGIVYLIIK